MMKVQLLTFKGILVSWLSDLSIMRKNDGLGNQQVLQVNDLDVFLTKWFIEITTKILKDILQCEFSITQKKN
jgi:hypothetical protein